MLGDEFDHDGGRVEGYAKRYVRREVDEIDGGMAVE